MLLNAYSLTVGLSLVHNPHCVCLLVQVQEHPGLRERHMGLLQGLTYAEAPVKQPMAWAALYGDSSSTRIPGGGESLNDLQERITAALLEIASWHPGEGVGGGTVKIVGQG